MFLFLYCLPAVTLSLLGSLVAVGIVAGLKRHRAHDEPE
jgi:hypothetical protein